jgi:hypothetical protein
MVCEKQQRRKCVKNACVSLTPVADGAVKRVGTRVVAKWERKACWMLWRKMKKMRTSASFILNNLT